MQFPSKPISPGVALPPGSGEKQVTITPHTLTAFDDDLDQLRAMVCEMGGRVEAAVADAVAALALADADRAHRVVTGDARVDGLAADIERHAIHLIALRSPLADDLREVLSAFKIANLIARMGDCAKNIAHRAIILGAARPLDQVRAIAGMREAVSPMVKGALDAFSTRDAALAARVLEMDDIVDTYHSGIFRALVDHMAAYPDSITAASHLMFVSQKLERIGDHAAAIASMVHFALTGRTAPGDEPAPPLKGAA